MTAFNYSRTIARIIASEETITEAQYADLTAYVSQGEVKVAGVAYAIRLRGIAGASGADSLKRMAADLGRSRGALAQWASAYGYLVAGNLPASDECFRDARRAYNSTAEGRAHVTKVLPEIAAADADARPAMLKALADKVAAWKRDAVKAEVTGEDSDADGVNVPTEAPVDVTAAWLEGLRVAAKVITVPGSQVALTDAQVKVAQSYLATIGEALASLVKA